jgi:ribose 5-phosphate isomerase B
MADKLKIAVAADPGGYPLRVAVLDYLSSRDDVETIDFGMTDPNEPIMYYLQAPKVAKAVQSGEADRGIICCGTGQGMAIIANKFKGVYAAVVDSVFSAERGKIINNANVITMGGMVTAPFLAKELVKAWLSVEFTQKMEDRAEIISNNFEQVKKMEEDLFR